MSIMNRSYPKLEVKVGVSCRPISFVVVKFCEDINHNFYKSKTIFDGKNQIILVDNTSNQYFENLSRSISFGVNQAKHDLVAVIHEDVLLVENWHQHFELSLQELERVDANWGMLGAVGWENNGTICGHWSDPHQYSNTFSGGQKFREVVKLDEQLLILNKKRMPDFDKSLPGIHHIGSDLRNQLKEKNYKTYVIDAPTIHKYADEKGEIIKSREDSPKINDRSSLTYLADKAICDRYIQKKWPQENIPHCLPLDDFLISNISKERAMQLNKPIIMLSRGGSGSRLCSLLAQDVGIFIGNDVAGTGDAMEMVSSIYQGVVSKYRCFEDWQKQEIVPRLRKAAHEMLSKVPEDVVWGFKLPETLFLLPEVRDAFPNAKYIHFVRDPLTTTLRRTHMTARLDNHIGRISLSLAYKYFGLTTEKMLSDSPALHMAYTTIFQLQALKEHAMNLNHESFFEIKYEDVLEKPNKQTKAVAEWLGLKKMNKSLAHSVDVNRSISPSVIYPDEIENTVKEVLSDIRVEFGYKY